jgi:hypothetical protein
MNIKVYMLPAPSSAQAEEGNMSFLSIHDINHLYFPIIPITDINEWLMVSAAGDGGESI